MTESTSLSMHVKSTQLPGAAWAHPTAWSTGSQSAFPPPDDSATL